MTHPHPDGATPARRIRGQLADDARLAEDLVGAVERGEFVAYFQPQTELATGRIVAAEALCRWKHPTIGLVPPALFITLAEQCDVIHEIGVFMLDESCGFLKKSRNFDEQLEVSVNVSPSQLTTSRVLEHLAPALDTGSLDPAKITLEITESMEIADVDLVVSRLHAMRELGIGISIDDFGSGHTSAEQLAHLPVTEVKIDRSLIQGRSDRQRNEVGTAMLLAAERNLLVVAEGVENIEHKRYARSVGCHRAQGYLLGRAMPLSWFESYLALQR